MDGGATQRVEARPRRLAPRRVRTGWCRGAPSYGPVTHRGTVGGKPVAFTDAALDLPARGRLDHRLPDVQRPGADELGGRPSSAPPTTSTTRSTGSTSTPPTPRTSTPGRTRCAPPASTRPADRGRARVRVGRAGPGRPTPPRTPRSPNTPLDQPGLLRQLEQQAGQGLRRRGLQLQLRRRAPRATCWTTGSRRRLAAGDKFDRATSDPGHGRGRRSPTCAAEQVLPDLLRVIDSQPVDRPRTGRARSAELRAWRRTAAGGWRPHAVARSTQHADAIRSCRRVVAAAGPGHVRARRSAPGLYQALINALQHQRVALRAAERGAGPTGQSRPGRTRARRSSTAGGATCDKDLRRGAR